MSETTTTGPFVPTAARQARAAREALAEKMFYEEVRRVESAIGRFTESLDQLGVRVSVAAENFERLAEMYREAGWLVSGSAGDLFMELPAPVEGVHPDRRQADGQPVLDFWRFVFERQRIYHLRAEDAPRPWTTDPVLRERFFTNIFRDLDPGTRVAFDIVNRPDAPAWERLWNLMVYRRFNRESTWDLIGYKALEMLVGDGPVTTSQLEQMRAYLRDLYNRLTRHRQETGQPIFTDAHQVYPMPMVPGPDLTARFMRVMLEQLDPDREHGNVFSLAEKLAAATTRREAYRAFVNARIPGVSNFLSWQMTMDCTYGHAPLVPADDDWAPITTGARFGAIMWKEWPKIGTVNYPIDGWPSLPTTPPAELERFVQGMRDEQEDRFEERGLDWGQLKGARRLDMPALEHALCEYSKYLAASVGLPTRDRWAQAQSGSGGRRQTFDETSESVQEAMKAIDLPRLGGGESWTPAARSLSGTAADSRAALQELADAGAGDTQEEAAHRAAGLPGSAEDRFREAVRAIDARGETPTPRLIFQELGMQSVSLNSRQAGWRRDELAQLGYVRDGNQYVRGDREQTDAEAAAEEATWD